MPSKEQGILTFNEITYRLSAADQKIIKDMLVLFDGIDRRTQEFSRQSGLKCKNGCGACCTNPGIETTVAEVLPLAVHLWSQGLAQSKLEDIQLNAAKGVCIFYEADAVDKNQGRCGIYAYRPGLCRLFGFTARRDKDGKQVLLTCKTIKDSQPQECQRTQEDLHKGLGAPLLTAHACSVVNIDPAHGQEFLPINRAISLGIEKIGYCLENLKQRLPAALE